MFNRIEGNQVKEACRRLCQEAENAPIPPLSPEAADAQLLLSLAIHELFPEAPEPSMEMVESMPQLIHSAMLELCNRVINSDFFDNIVQVLGLTVQNIPLLSIRKLGALLGLEMVRANSPIPTASSDKVARLFAKLKDIGIDFGMLASKEDLEFEVIVSKAHIFLELLHSGTPLNRLLELKVVPLTALTLGFIENNEQIDRERAMALEFLNTAPHQLAP